ncbi:MAG: hypothetical protein J5507_03060 [Clostridia bacterium]|nr:hypothetical protein [Clostridia bacterium]
MGFLDRFKKRGNSIQPTQNNMESNQDYQVPDIPLKVTGDNMVQADFYDHKPKLNQFYDITRLILDMKAKNIEGESVYEGLVSWYGENDCQTLNRTTGTCESPRASAYKKVLFQMNIDLFFNDPDYRYFVLGGLLNENRVNRYLNAGLQENPDKPCGNYIGGVRAFEGKYQKFFESKIGTAVHNSEPMKAMREEIRRRNEEIRQKRIEEKRRELEALENGEDIR